MATASCSDGGIDKAEVEQFLQDYVDAYCDFSQRCCAPLERSFPTLVDCKETLGPRLDQRFQFRHERRAAVFFDSSGARSCVKLLGQDCKAASEARDCLDDVTQGKLSAGEPCQYSAECESFICKIGQASAAVCGPSPGEGSCSGDDRACGAAAYCHQGTDSCMPKKVGNASCLLPEECLSGVCAATIRLCVDVNQETLCDGQ